MRKLILLVPLTVGFANPQIVSSQEKVRIIDRPTMNVETTCNADGEATAPVTLRNDGAEMVLLRLSAGDLSSKSPAKHLFVFPTLVPKDSSLDPEKELTIQATVTGLHDHGEWESTIQNDGVDVGTLRIVRVTPQFALSLDVPKPDDPELTFIKGEPAHFRLKNADPEEYRFGWEYSVNGRVVSSTDPDVLNLPPSHTWYCRWFCEENNSTAAVRISSNSLVIPAGAQKEIIFTPQPKWFGGWFTGLFKDAVTDGRLTVSLNPPNCAADPPISKTFAIKTHLATSSGSWREAWADFWVFLFLALGGVF